jgi:hypothetical protein
MTAFCGAVCRRSQDTKAGTRGAVFLILMIRTRFPVGQDRLARK